MSARLGLAGIPSISESTLIARDAALAGYEGGRIHIQHLSARESVEAVAAAKASGVRITCEACPHHLTLTDQALLERPRHAAEDEPAAAHRGRPAGAHRGAARRHDRLHRHRPRAARARGEGGGVRGGADGHDRARDGVRRASTPSSCCPACCRSAWSSQKLSAGAALLDLPLPGVAGGRGRRTSASSTWRRSGTSASTATRAARRTAASPAGRLQRAGAVDGGGGRRRLPGADVRWAASTTGSRWAA